MVISSHDIFGSQGCTAEIVCRFSIEPFDWGVFLDLVFVCSDLHVLAQRLISQFIFQLFVLLVYIKWMIYQLSDQVRAT